MSHLSLLVEFGRTLLTLLLLALAFLQQGLRDEDLVMSGHAPIGNNIYSVSIVCPLAEVGIRRV